MKQFDESYILLRAMVSDSYYPNFLVEKVEETMAPVIRMLEAGETDLDVIQDKLDEMTLAINELEAEFEEHDSELETVARESIAETVEYILEWFQIDIDTETAIREHLPISKTAKPAGWKRSAPTPAALMPCSNPSWSPPAPPTSTMWPSTACSPSASWATKA